ncbi:hypothetical protein ACFWIJ_40640, partial [Streptomyces sp. NPDC127079]
MAPDPPSGIDRFPASSITAPLSGVGTVASPQGLCPNAPKRSGRRPNPPRFPAGPARLPLPARD